MRAALLQNRARSLHIIAVSAFSLWSTTGPRMYPRQNRRLHVISCATCPAATVKWATNTRASDQQTKNSGECDLCVAPRSFTARSGMRYVGLPHYSRHDRDGAQDVVLDQVSHARKIPGSMSCILRARKASERGSKKAFCRGLNSGELWSGKRGSNPRPSAWETLGLHCGHWTYEAVQ
jgi:hypothetical protein